MIKDYFGLKIKVGDKVICSAIGGFENGFVIKLMDNNRIQIHSKFGGNVVRNAESCINVTEQIKMIKTVYPEEFI